MLCVGLTGGLASGKGVIAKELARLGCHLIEADALGHDVLLPTGEAYQPVVRAFGEARVVNHGANANRRGRRCLWS